MGFNQTSEGADGSSTSVVFRWTSRLELSASQMETGLELCWKAVEDALFPLGSISDYTAKFGTVSIAGNNAFISVGTVSFFTCMLGMYQFYGCSTNA